MKRFKTNAQQERTERRVKKKREGRKQSRIQAQAATEQDLMNFLACGALIDR